MKRMLGYALSLLICSACSAGEKQPALGKQWVQTNLGPGCHIAVSLPQSTTSGVGNGGDPKFGEGGLRVKPLPKSWKSSLEALYLNLYCNDNDMEARSKGTISKYDPAHHEWVKDLHRAYPQFTDQELKEIDGATSVLNIQARNASGYVSFQRDTTGDECGRTKVVDFCLFHETRALCGTGTVAQLIDGARGDLTKQTLDIIKSIDFLDDEEPVHLSPGASEPSH